MMLIKEPNQGWEYKLNLSWSIWMNIYSQYLSTCQVPLLNQGQTQSGYSGKLKSISRRRIQSCWKLGKGLVTTPLWRRSEKRGLKVGMHMIWIENWYGSRTIWIEMDRVRARKEGRMIQWAGTQTTINRPACFNLKLKTWTCLNKCVAATPSCTSSWTRKNL